MQRYVEEMGMGKNPKVLLVGGMSAQEILIATPLLRWYLQHGIEVTNIYQVVEYQQKRCFNGLAQSITEARRAGDINPDLKIMADTKKKRKATRPTDVYAWIKLNTATLVITKET